MVRGPVHDQLAEDAMSSNDKDDNGLKRLDLLLSGG
jgi:hypothetical protein